MPLVVAQPPITTSCPARHLDFAQCPYGRRHRAHRRASKRCPRAIAGKPSARPRRRRSRNARRNEIGNRRRHRSASCCNRALRSVSARPADRRRLRTDRSKAKKTSSSVLPSESAAWSAAKSGAPFSSRAQISPSMIASGSLRAARAMAGNFVGPVKALTGLQGRLAVKHA